MEEILKSNMDRFIVLVKYGDTEFKRILKSNMDRFIVDVISVL